MRAITRPTASVLVKVSLAPVEASSTIPRISPLASRDARTMKLLGLPRLLAPMRNPFSHAACESGVCESVKKPLTEFRRFFEAQDQRRQWSGLTVTLRGGLWLGCLGGESGGYRAPSRSSLLDRTVA